MKLSLLSHTPDPEKLVAAAAKLCYSKAGIDDLLAGLGEKTTAAFLERLVELGHYSPFEHASFTFGIEGVSRALLAQLTRHRIASFSVQSQRYVESGGDFEHILPPSIATDPETAGIFDDAMQKLGETYTTLAQALRERYLERLGESSAEERRAAEKKALEDARFVLPNAAATKIIMTMNVRALRGFFAQRCCGRAQWEIRELASQMLTLCKRVSPLLFKGTGPACIGGRCPEGKLSCGQQEAMRAKYGLLK